MGARWLNPVCFSMVSVFCVGLSDICEWSEADDVITLL